MTTNCTTIKKLGDFCEEAHMPLLRVLSGNDLLLKIKIFLLKSIVSLWCDRFFSKVNHWFVTVASLFVSLWIVCKSWLEISLLQLCPLYAFFAFASNHNWQNDVWFAVTSFSALLALNSSNEFLGRRIWTFFKF